MLFMSVYTYEPTQREEIVKRRMEEGLSTPEGIKLIGQWSNASGGQVFTLFEADDPLVLAQWSNPWNNLGNLETFIVIDTEELIKAMTAR
jgi:hypothetical protein